MWIVISQIDKKNDRHVVVYRTNQNVSPLIKLPDEIDSIYVMMHSTGHMICARHIYIRRFHSTAADQFKFSFLSAVLVIFRNAAAANFLRFAHLVQIMDFQ